MTQSGRYHVGIVMDGNGRWATRRGLPRAVGHRAGARTVRRIVEAAPTLGIGTLTLYAFSADNWKRPLPEVAELMRLFRRHLVEEGPRLAANGIRLNVIGRRDRLAVPVRRAIDEAEALTAGGATMLLRLAIDYSGRDAIVRAAAGLPPGASLDHRRFGARVAAVDHAVGPVTPVDLIIRTGGDQRLSDFLLWESAYAELFFRPEAWPDFGPADLTAVIAEFEGRERRFGGLSLAEPESPARANGRALP